MPYKYGKRARNFFFFFFFGGGGALLSPFQSSFPRF